MPKTIEHYKNRINILTARGYEMNHNIINKMERKIRKLQAIEGK